MSQDLKQRTIIEAATKRFAHFGVAKTTMSEIASDLSMSKAALYYYFPDKNSLYAAVLNTIMDENAAQNDVVLQKENNPFKAINFYLERRTQFIIKYHNLVEYLKTYSMNNLPSELQPLFMRIRNREMERVVSILEKGVQNGMFKIDNIKSTAELFFDFLEGFRNLSFAHNRTIFPDKKEFLSVLKREIEFANIFFRGLTVS